MIEYMKNIVKWVLNTLPAAKVIMLESCPDFSDNTRAVFEEMIRRGINRKYKIVWWVSDHDKPFPKYRNVYYLDQKTVFSKLIFFYLNARAQCLVSCNQFLESYYAHQTSFYLTHGTAIKSIRSYYFLPEHIDYILTASEHSSEIMAYEMNGKKERFYAFGFPRNDVFSQKEKDVRSLLNTDAKKVIIWYPTFRQAKNGKQTASKIGLPIVHDGHLATRLNERAAQNGVLIVVKPHFAQNVQYIKDYGLSNIVLIDDNFYEKHQISSYEFVNSCDALITDYSSIYFDYLLCDKPVAAVWEDFDDYKKDPGFAIDIRQYMKGAAEIYNIDGFLKFVDDVANERDEGLLSRQKVSKKMNLSNDGKNAQRVVDFICERAHLKGFDKA